MKTITSKEKVTMYLIEYYFGYSNRITPLRLVGGPFFVLLGITLLIKNYYEFTIFYAGFCFIYGAYFMLRPYLWILFRLENYKTEKISVDFKENILCIRDEKKNESKINIDSCKEIKERKNYFVFIMTKIHRISIPKHLFTTEHCQIIKQNRTFNK